MDFDTLLFELRSERDALTDAILALERLAAGSGTAKKRGRPRKPDAPTATPVNGKGKHTRKPRSPEARAKMAEAQRRRWDAWKQAHQAEEAHE